LKTIFNFQAFGHFKEFPKNFQRLKSARFFSVEDDTDDDDDDDDVNR